MGGRFFWTKQVVVFGFLCGVVLSKHLWVSSRHFPLLPVFSGLPQIPYPFDYIGLAGILVLLVLIASSSNPRIPIVLLLLLVLCLGLLDQCRWQPWAYQYSLMLAAIAVVYWKTHDLVSEEAALNMCRLIVAGIYFYSGLQKLNPEFAPHVFPQLLGGEKAPATTLVLLLAILAPLIEAATGIGLLTKKTRKLSVFLALTMHTIILLRFGPLGFNHNNVVWPWNVAMMILDLLLFWNADFSFKDVLWKNPFVFQKALLILVLVMPFFSFFGWWDSYLSWSLYSGNVDSANIFCSNAVANQLPDFVQKYVVHVSGDNNKLPIRDWALGELNVPPYPEARVYRQIGAEVCRLSNNSPDMALYIKQKVRLQGGNVTVRDTCFGTLVVH